ncbi:hypothetical protein J3Q64DRAFT_1838291 [Phycomyces blakesleeanus]|uniref:Uncharacterized protein n=2 Tax=Phycomyces blakesleeanus TaxID=4837 RepID=A0A162NFK0_PHYB8|nr:hypothetical protein PHYBLDRAFT_66896 [Phycomyces blakesleeanus NRRL 1555(-)]OAD69134.1 hypothetical protein PHYBLDRAFT_66896 [Phycomyces blakesleeanus NRRL 1555(-)]|eukprot:XP_018287174.1 hypothetical protein PHYBLDRAFT_66896 [Phycomyces blakesleeanus NRRL 1555(-)]
MIPRLPPFLLAVVGGASIYGVKILLDKLEPKLLGAPGSSDHAEKRIRFRQNVRLGGAVIVGTGVLCAAYWAYDARINRPSPAVSTQNSVDFYQDQYDARERRQRDDAARIKEEQRVSETVAQKRLTEEQLSMERIASSNQLK